MEIMENDKDPHLELEIKITYLEKTLSELNEVVFKQQKKMDVLEKNIQKSQARIDEMEQSSGSDLAHVKPPHY